MEKDECVSGGYEHALGNGKDDDDGDHHAPNRTDGVAGGFERTLVEVAHTPGESDRVPDESGCGPSAHHHVVVDGQGAGEGRVPMRAPLPHDWGERLTVSKSGDGGVSSRGHSEQLGRGVGGAERGRLAR